MSESVENDVYYEDWDIYRDVYKDVHGFRPSIEKMREWKAMKPGQQRAEMDRLQALLDIELERKEQERKAALNKFVTKYAELVASGLLPDDAILKIAAEVGVSKRDLDVQGLSFLEYSLGIKFNTLNAMFPSNQWKGKP